MLKSVRFARPALAVVGWQGKGGVLPQRRRGRGGVVATAYFAKAAKARERDELV